MAQSLSPGSTWYWKIIAKDTEGNSAPSATWSFVVVKAVAPMAPGNCRASSSSDGRTIALTWQAPTVNADGAALTQLAGYRVYRAYDLNSLLSTDASSTVSASSSLFTDQISAGQTVFYQVSAFNVLGGESERSRAVLAGALGELLSYTNDCNLIVSCAANVVPSSVTVIVSRNTELEYGAVLRHYSLHVISGGVEDKKFSFAKPITLSLNSGAVASAVALCRRAPDSTPPATGIFWNNGVEWIYLGGQNSNGDISVRASSAGQYELRTVSRSTEFHVLSHWPAIITPNGDNVNDELNVTFENPMSDGADGQIYNLSGSHVAKMSAKTDTWFIWSGYDNNGVRVAPGIYIYQLKCGSKLFNGTVVVAR
jgi:hypothetical protein